MKSIYDAITKLSALKKSGIAPENHLLIGGFPRGYSAWIPEQPKISTDDRGLRPSVKKYNPRSEVDHFRIYTNKEVVLLYNFDFIPPPLFFFVGNTFFFPRRKLFFYNLEEQSQYVNK